MDDQDYIRQAVELADGFKWLHRDQVEIPDLNNVVLRPFEQQWFFDSLAAQLVRQVELCAGVNVITGRQSVVVYDTESPKRFTPTSEMGRASSPDRTMNTIKAIVDSKVLAGLQ